MFMGWDVCWSILCYIILYYNIYVLSIFCYVYILYYYVCIYIYITYRICLGLADVLATCSLQSQVAPPDPGTSEHLKKN